uniref:C2 domain-containing protein n=1 Tax=Alexandrium andersonii TaxID=327968 RepID=A0A7S2NF99_9DINO|mmetsp:Transcript_94284/g.211362  ORF Transcript_94284/g.211362 Transcript_94284/m.211362 type:complete len:142 (+) Transcript_94284:58-483(+)
MSAIKGKILKAEGLKNVDLWGKSDPFVHIFFEKCGGDKLGESRTATKTDDLNPVWEDENFNFACPDSEDLLDTQLRFQVMDTGLGPDVELGTVTIPTKLIPLLVDGAEATVFEVSLGIVKKKSMGKIWVQVGVLPAPSLFG